MKRIHSIFTTLFLTSLFITGCAMRTPSPSPIVSTLPPKPTATSLAHISVTFPTETATPESIDTLLFRDDFNGTLGEGWTWVSEYPGSWSLTAVPRTLQIMAGSGYVNSGNMTNILVRPIPEGDFEIRTLVTFTPDSNFQFAGLLVYESKTRYLQAGRGFCLLQNICDGDGLYLDVYNADKFERANFGATYVGQDSVFLRLRREYQTYNQAYTLLASRDGIVWQEVGRRELAFNPVLIGIIAGQNNRKSIPANFDFFEVRSLP